MEELPSGELPDQRNKRYGINTRFVLSNNRIRFRYDIAEIAVHYTFLVLTYIRSRNDPRWTIRRIIIDDSSRCLATAIFDRGFYNGFKTV